MKRYNNVFAHFNISGNIIGVDFAKDTILVSVVTAHKKERVNKTLSRKKFTELHAKWKRSLVAVKSFSMAHYWTRVAQHHGHDVRIIPAKAVAPYDALAVAEAAARSNVKKPQFRR